ncbi:MAG: guanitoxin biosynthesis heme-dependent pre-guanitoxin N-hydroxylase GntA [Vicinamibacterales bacterium]
MSAPLGRRVEEAFRDFIADPRYPCLAATGVAQRRDYDLHVYGRLGSADSSTSLGSHLGRFTEAAKSRAAGDSLTAFVAVFTGRPPAGERAFERRLWMTLQALHDREHPSTEWDPAVSADPDDSRFSFSFGGCALFVIGLHPNSSRLARRFRWPALVFNPHQQFERLRHGGHFASLRDRIRARDRALQGTINPNLADFGERSEANQYSGRDTSGAWRCPFHARKS